MNEDYAYTSPFKKIWDRKKCNFAVGQCFNAFDLLRPTLPNNLPTLSNHYPTSAPFQLHPPRLTATQIENILREYEDPAGLVTGASETPGKGGNPLGK